MPLTHLQAQDDICGALAATWAGNGATSPYPLLFENTGEQRPSPTADVVLPWAWAQVRRVTSPQSSLTSDDAGRKRYTTRGFVGVQIFTPRGDGSTGALTVGTVVEGAFKGKRTANGVVFSHVRLKEIGPSGPWMQSDVEADFEYDSIQ
jgi:hypothetical protein